MKKAAFIAVILGTASIITTGAVLAKGGPGSHGPRMSFEEIDADGNGEVTQAEMDALKVARFAKSDTNGDGVLSLEELTAQGIKNVAERTERMLAQRDTNGDGVLSADEMSPQRRSGKMLERFDADGNGSISKEEFEEASNRMRQRGKGQHRPGQQSGVETEQN